MNNEYVVYNNEMKQNKMILYFAIWLNHSLFGSDGISARLKIVVSCWSTQCDQKPKSK